ncbi:MAG: dTDP-4-dehydrorhamnose 3,5-epimerase, partial [Deltaproteobacteria bacterium]|nr:dTDP-4-dehydrorhamnose 3,5-epimerase [Deltaproteobacteria bacterium]
MPFKFRELEIPGVILVESKIFNDGRGCFMEIFKQSDFHEFGIREPFTQDNYSISSKGVLRGLHYQVGSHVQGKLIRCLSGAIFDVAVDIRNNSPTFGKWVSAELTSEMGHMLYIPPGLAHGFIVTSKQAQILYKCTREYSKTDERGIIWNDPEIGI